MSDFVTVFENNFTPHADLRQATFKCSLTIVNWQPAPGPGFAEITNTVGSGKQMFIMECLLTIL